VGSMGRNSAFFFPVMYIGMIEAKYKLYKKLCPNNKTWPFKKHHTFLKGILYALLCGIIASTLLFTINNIIAFCLLIVLLPGWHYFMAYKYYKDQKSWKIQ